MTPDISGTTEIWLQGHQGCMDGQPEREARPVVMVVHPDPDWGLDLASMLHPDVVVRVFNDPRAALAHVKVEPPRLVLAALKMPSISGLELVQHLHREHQDVRCIVLAPNGHDARQTAEGALAVPHPMELGELRQIVHAVLGVGVTPVRVRAAPVEDNTASIGPEATHRGAATTP